MKHKEKIIFFSVLFAFIVFCVIIFSPNSSHSQNNICMISINHIQIGTKASKKMKKVVMDAGFKYEYNHVGFNTDDDGYIDSIYFYTTTSGKKTYGIHEAKVKYKSRRLTRIEDFNRILGEGQEKISVSDSAYKYITYVEDDYELELLTKGDIILNISIIQK